MSDADSARRAFLLGSSGLLGGAWLASSWPAITAAHDAAAHAASASPGVFTWLSGTQAADVEALTAQIVPSGATPGAREAHAVHFIDHALGSFFSYRAQAFAQGLTEFQAAFRRVHPQGSFAAAPEVEQLAFLGTVDHTPFFDSVRELTLLGMLSLPGYGGNHDRAGWRLVGFTDMHAFLPPFGHYDRDYPGFKPPAPRGT